MADKKERFSTKKEIINYFDSLINRVDIDIDECIQNHNQEQILSQLPCFDIENRKLKSLIDFSLEYFDSYKSNQNTCQTVDQWPESTKVIDYLNQIRKRTIDELTKAQQESLQYLRLNLSQFKTNENQITEDEFRSEVFKEKFYFQVLYKPVDPKYSMPWIFNLYTFVTDFYMSPTDINLLETFINSSSQEQDNEGNYIKHQGSDIELILDEKMILIGLLQKRFFKNLQTQKFPSCVISVSKHELLNIQRIFVRYQLIEVNLSASSKELSNLEELILEGETKESSKIKIKGLCSLKHLYLKCFSTAQISLNLNELREFDLHLIGSLNSDFQSKLFDYLPNIEILFLNATYLSNFSLDRFINLKVLTIIGIIMDDFNFGLFDNLCNQLEEIGIFCPNMDDKCLDKLFDHSFPFLQNLIITESSITKLEMKFLKAFPALQSLEIYKNIELCLIDDDAFSNSKHLVVLNLKDNCIKSISKKHFSDLAKLKVINMSNNRLETIEENMFSSQKSLELVDLSNNQLSSLHPKSFADLRNLRYVDLENNKLRHFNLDVSDNTREIQINLSRNPIINKKEIFNRFVKPQIKRYIYF